TEVELRQVAGDGTNPERADHIEETHEAERRRVGDFGRGEIRVKAPLGAKLPWILDLPVFDHVAEIEARGRAAAEANQINGRVVVFDDVDAEPVVGIQQTVQLPGAKRPADGARDAVNDRDALESCADS